MSLGWQHIAQSWVCGREDPTIHSSTIMSCSRLSVGVVLKCWAGKVKVSPTGLIWEECGAESSSEATQKITITRNYSLKTLGKGALYLPVLAQHSTVPLIATLLLAYLFPRHLRYIVQACTRHTFPIPYSFEKQWSSFENVYLCKLFSFS